MEAPIYLLSEGRDKINTKITMLEHRIFTNPKNSGYNLEKLKNDKSALESLKNDKEETNKAISKLKEWAGKHQSEVKKALLQNVSNAMLIDWWYNDENGTEVMVKAIVDKWCVVTDIMHDEPYNVELEFVQKMYKDSIDC